MTLIPATGMNYLRVLRQMHRRLRPEWYLEVGTFKGDSLALSHCRSIAIDPRFKVRSNVLRGKPQCVFLQQPSDEAFESGVIEALKARFDLAFLDGLHLYEFLLRDFMNAERSASGDAVFFMHDCLPATVNMTVRDRSLCETPEWTGDVWKVLPILREYRPDLEVTVLNAAPTGLVAVQNMDPKNTVLWDHYEEIRERFDALELADWGTDRLVALADPQPAAAFVSRFLPDTERLEFAIKIATPDPDSGQRWGEHEFAEGLTDALRRLGHGARVDTIRQWKQAHPDEIDLVVRAHGFRKRVYVPDGQRPALMWAIYPAWPEATDDECAAFEHIWCASRDMSLPSSTRSSSYLPQAFDARRMAPVEAPERKSLVYVANNYQRRGRLRQMAEWATEAGLDLAVWGQGWSGTPLESFVVAEHIDNKELGRLYGNALAVLNDHGNDMGRTGFVSNRIFDALACAAPVISDKVRGLPDDMAPFVLQVDGPEALAGAVTAIKGEDAARREARVQFAGQMRRTHSFDARAAAIVARATEIMRQPELEAAE